MKAISYTQLGNPKLVNINEPNIIRKDWIKVRVKKVGLCGSDIQKFFSSADRDILSLTPILGHEIAGKVVRIGEQVKKINLNDNVVINPLISCGNCTSCREKKHQLCRKLISLGKHIPGGFAEYIAVPAKNVLKFPNKISFDEACLNDVVAVGLHAYHLANSPKRKLVLVIGDGPVALILIQLLIYFQNEVYVVGKHKRNLSVAKSSGALLALSKNFKKQFDIIFEAVGRSQDDTMRIAIEKVKPGGTIIVLGVFNSIYIGQVPFRELFYKEITLKGSNSHGVWDNKNEFEESLQLIIKGAVRPKKIISHVLGLSEIKLALKHVKERDTFQAIKIVFDPAK